MPHSLITGGAGFIGSHLAETLIDRGDQVTVIDDESTGNPANLAAIAGNSSLRYVKGTVADDALMRQLFDGVDEVYHLAAAVGVVLIASNPIQTIETNIYPTQKLLDELRRLHRAGKPVKLFLASSSEVCCRNRQTAS
jgi:UDP-glucose 4-epimerase